MTAGITDASFLSYGIDFIDEDDGSAYRFRFAE